MSQNIKYVSLLENSGYGIAANSYLQALMESELSLTWTPMVRGKSVGLPYEPFRGKSTGNELLDPICNKPMDYDAVIVHTIPEFYTYWRKREKNKYLIGYTVWETTRPPDHWKDLINQLDHLLVPTEWNKTVFKEHGITIPIDVIPHFSEFEGVPATHTDLHQWESDRFLFYIISTWTERKTIWKLIEAYLQAFSPEDRVELLIKTSKVDTTKRRNKLFRYLGFPFKSIRKTFDNYVDRTQNIPKITLVADDTKPDDYICALHTRGDCYVSLCRSEGWGIGAFEAARFGKPVIMTGFGGQTDYLAPQHTFLVDYDLVPVMDQCTPIV